MHRSVERLLQALAALLPITAPLAGQESGAAQEPVALPELRTAGQALPWAHELSDLPADPRVNYGALANGMRWAWVNHPEPNKRVYVRLHVDVGSLAETEAERGMAHFLEHMAFNGSKNFAAGTLIEWFQEQGMSFGADTNAHTSFSETVYKLDLPENDAETLREGLLVLRDFADGLLIAEAEVQAEKGVIDGEERERESAGMRAFIELLEKQYAGTLYPERLPIGTKAARDAFDAASVRAFYERWYRPENMSLIIVGDLGELNPQPLIEEFFASMQGPKGVVQPEPDAGLPSWEQPFVAVQNQELPTMQLSLAMAKPAVERPDSAAQRLEDLRLMVAMGMLNQRFSEMLKDPGTPFLGASVGEFGDFDLMEGGSLSVVATPTQWQAALEAAFVEVRRALNFGFQEVELDEERAGWLLSLREGAEREKTMHSLAIAEGLLLEVEEEVVPTSAAYDLELLAPALEALTPEECLDALRAAWRGGQLVMSCVGPVALEDPESQLRAVFEAAREREIERGEDREALLWAYATDPEQRGAIAERQHLEDLDAHLIRFENGVMLNLKQTDFREREVMSAVRFGRGSLAMPMDERAVFALGGPLFGGAGLEAHSADELRRLVAGQQVGFAFGIDEQGFLFSGTTNKDDLLMQLEVMRAQLEHPGWRPDLLPLIQAQIPLIFEQFRHAPDGPLLLEFLPMFMQGDSRAQLFGLRQFPSQEELAAFDMDRMQELLGGPVGEPPLEVTLIGDFDLEQAIDAVAQVFGTLPQREAMLLPAVMPQASLKSGLKLESEIETDDEKATLFLFFPTRHGMEDELRWHLSFLGDIVDDRLRLKVREELGAAYSPGAVSEVSDTWLNLGAVLIQAAGDPAQAEALLEACLGVAQDLANNGVTEEEVARLSEPVLKQFRDAQRQNGFWLETLQDVQSQPRQLASLRKVLAEYGSFDAKRLSELAAEYLQPERASYLMVLPSEVEEGESDE